MSSPARISRLNCTVPGTASGSLSQHLSLDYGPNNLPLEARESPSQIDSDQRCHLLFVLPGANVKIPVLAKQDRCEASL